MVKHTQTICQQKPTNCLSVLDHFVGLALGGFNGFFWEQNAYQLLQKFKSVIQKINQTIKPEELLIGSEVVLVVN